MIKKVANIKNVGRFRNFSPRGGTECEFNQNTIIYGDNARGKSTFTAILRSLATNKSDYIVGRKSFGSSSNPEVTVVMDGNINHTFSLNRWSNSYPNLLIFDSCFVNKNVYVAESITEDNEKAIESIILGETGRHLHDAFLEAEKNCQDNTNRKAAISREYSGHLGHYSYPFQNFRQIKIDLGIDLKIEDLEKEIKANLSRQKIIDLVSSFKRKITNTNLIQIQTSLSPTIKVEQNDIKKHILDNFNDSSKAESFLSMGKNLIKPKTDEERNCIFCGQKLTPSAENLIEAYELLFSKSYENLVSNLKLATSFFENWKVENEIKQFIAEMETCGIVLNFDGDIKIIKEQIEEFKKELVKKVDLNYQIDFSSTQKISGALSNIEGELDKQLLKYKNEQTPEQIKLIQSKKNQLLLTKARGEEIWVKLCSEYSELESNDVTLKEKRDQSFNSKNKYSEEILKKYESEVNKILVDLKANFKLVDTTPKSSVRSTSRLFNISFGTNKVSLTNSESTPCFANSLSESDKRVLAFAFFLAGIKVQGDMSQKIIVLDDPVSSFDGGRKYSTTIMLRKFFEENKPKQVIFLTHDLNFLSMLTRSFDSSKCFKIDYSPADDNSSIIPMDPTNECLDNYYQQLSNLKSIETMPDSEVSWDKLRPIRDCLEELFKKKYYFYLKDLIQSTGGGTISYTKKLKDEGIYNDERMKQINDLLANFWNHDDSTALVKRSDYQVDDLRTIVTNFFKAVEII